MSKLLMLRLRDWIHRRRMRQSVSMLFPHWLKMSMDSGRDDISIDFSDTGDVCVRSSRSDRKIGIPLRQAFHLFQEDEFKELDRLFGTCLKVLK